jgi:carboxyl-terminal processing protease
MLLAAFPLKAQQLPLPLDDLRTFAEVFDRIKSAYVEEVDDRTLLNNAIKGMLSELDPHSSYLTPEDYQNLRVNTTGEFGGLGIEVGMENGFIKVIAPIDDTPAQRAGIEPGDLIIKLDEEPIKGISLSDAVERMRGEPGSAITLTIMRPGEPAPIDLTIVRDVIQVRSVRAEMLEDGFGYLRITQFQLNSGKELVNSIAKLRASNDEFKGLVLDLRNNPGGVLQAAVDVADAFLSAGNIVYTKGRYPNSRLSFDATQEDPSRGLPLVVLINSGSASASEIVAGALQDHKRAIIMGTSSFGKGSVQSVLPLNNNRAVKLTTALYYTPKGRSIQAEGIEPDLLVERAKVTTLQSVPRVKEADLKGHLGNGNGDTESGREKSVPGDLTVEGAAETDNGVGNMQARLQEDYQLAQALYLLKGLHLAGGKKPAPALSPRPAPASAETKP